MDRALVLGGSVAGLAAAAMLAEHAREVLIVEPDRLGSEPAVRGGVPQSGHSHLLLGRGRQALDALLPGMSADLIAAGAQLVDPRTDAGWYLDGLKRTPVPGDSLVSLTRPLLESRIRSRVLDLPQVSILPGRATGLTVTGTRVDGALVQRDGTTSAERVGADLVVDATGRSSRLTSWLTALGYPAPPKQRVAVEIGYGTCFFRREEGQRVADVMMAHSVRSGRGGRPGAGSVSPVEGGRWMVLITGFAAQQPVRDLDDFMDRCLRDPAPPIRLVAETCEPVSDVAVYRFADNVRRDFHQMPNMPGALVAVGDAVASFNPVYGQGMTSALLHAEALSRWLRSGPRLERPAGAYFRRVGKLVDAAWTTSAGNDRLLPHVRTGPLSRRDLLHVRLSQMIAIGSLTDPKVAEIFYDVVNMRTHPRRMRQPDVVWRAARASRRFRSAAETAAGSSTVAPNTSPAETKVA